MMNDVQKLLEEIDFMYTKSYLGDLPKLQKDPYIAQIQKAFGLTYSEVPACIKQFEAKNVEKNMNEIDISEEIKDLLEVYSTTLEEAKVIEDYALLKLNLNMKRYLEVKEKREEAQRKIDVLESKLKGVDESEEEEDEDE